MNTAWFSLWLYNLIGAGPDAILFAAGTRVTHLPRMFEKYETVMVTSWAHEGQEVAVNALLVLLNDTLSYAPVLVTGHRLHNVHVRVEHVPFPLARFELKHSTNSAQIPRQQTIDDLLGSSSTDMDPVPHEATLSK
jgi:hypothetical protein